MNRITTKGTDHYDPRPMTSWQRDHRDGPLQPEYKSEHWLVSLSIWIGIIAFVACVYIIAQAYVDAQALAHAV